MRCADGIVDASGARKRRDHRARRVGPRIRQIRPLRALYKKSARGEGYRREEDDVLIYSILLSPSSARIEGCTHRIRQENVNGIGTSRQASAGRAAGKSFQSRQSFIYLSDLAGRRPGRPQDAIRATLGQRRPPGRIVRYPLGTPPPRVAFLAARSPLRTGLRWLHWLCFDMEVTR